VSNTDPPAPNQHHTRTGHERPRATAISVIPCQPPDPPRSSNGATTMLSSPAFGAVLVADTGGPTAGISHYAGAETPRSLSEVSELLAASLPIGQLLATTSDGMRVLATGPRLAADCARDGIELLLDHARRRYALTVIDCGTLAREADQIALASATHVAWVLTATAGAAIRGRQLLDAIGQHQSGREILIARHEPRDRRKALRELRDLARHRRALLILLPSMPELATGNSDAALETAQVPLQAILGALGR